MINRFAGTFYLEQFSYIISLVYGLRPFYSAVVNLDQLDLPVQKATLILMVSVGTVRYLYAGHMSLRHYQTSVRVFLVCWENCVLRTPWLSPIKI